MTEVAEKLKLLPKGARVVIRSRNGNGLARTLLACLDMELVAVPLHPRSPDDQVVRLAEKVDASLIVDAITEPTSFVLRDAPTAGDGVGLALIMFTSGSTGRPKGVALSRDAVFGNATRTALLHGFQKSRPHGTCLPLYHCNALVMSLVGTHITDTPLLIAERFDPINYFHVLDVHHAKTASIVPALLEDLLVALPKWPEGLEYLISAAAPLSSDLCQRFYRAYGPRLRQGYGLTETTNFSSLMPVLNDADFVTQYVSNAPPVGLPLPSTDIQLENGEVWIRSPDVMNGYYDDPQATAEALRPDGWLRTGDLGVFRDDFLVLHGRRKDVINRGGEKFYPGDIEAIWRRSGLSGMFAALPIAEKSLGQDIGLVLEGSIHESKRVMADSEMRPAAVSSGGLMTTSTGKPQRALMARGLVAKRESGRRYEELLSYAADAARAIIDSPHPPRTAQSVHLRMRASSLAKACPPSKVQSRYPRTAAHDVLDGLIEYWPMFAAGRDAGEAMMRRNPGLWRRLMTEWPMGSYADLMVQALQSGELLEGRVLEVGSGVGNTTSLIADLVNGDFVWSDRAENLVRRGKWPGQGVFFDLDGNAPADIGKFDTILGTNVFHCTADKEKSLRLMHSLLSDNGRLIIAEGSSPTVEDGVPWALDFLFALWDGWWDRDGFRTRWEWLTTFENSGFRDLGFSTIRAGGHDLGGLIWGDKTAGA